MKFLLLLLLLASTDAKSLGHNVSSIRKTNSGAVKNILPLQEMNRYDKANTIRCAELLDGDSSSEVISTCSSITGYPEYTLRVLDAKGASWNSFNSRLTSITSVALVIEGSDIDKLKLDQLVSFTGSKDIIIKNNKDLNEISFTVKEHMSIGKLIITDNEMLKSIKIEPAKTFECTEIIINNNIVLLTVKFVGAATYTMPQLTIRQNAQLNDFSGIEKLKPDANVIFEGNRDVKAEDLNQLKSINSSWKIQPYGHCTFDKPIEMLNELNKCVVVDKIIFAKGATGLVASMQLRTVNEEIHLADLSYERVKFLEEGVILPQKITSDLCGFPPIKGIKVISPPCTTTTEESITAASPGSGPSPGPGPSPGSGPSPGAGPSHGPGRSPGSSSNSSNSAPNSSSSSGNGSSWVAGVPNWVIIAFCCIVLIIIIVIVVYIYYRMTRMPGQTFCSWVRYRKEDSDEEVELEEKEEEKEKKEERDKARIADKKALANCECGRDGDLPIYVDIPRRYVEHGSGRRIIPEHDYMTYKRIIHWKGDFKERPYKEKLRSMTDLPDVKKMPPIQKDKIYISMTRFDGGLDGDLKEGYFYNKYIRKVGSEKRRREILHVMVDTRINQSFNEYYKYLKNNKMLLSFPKPSKERIRNDGFDRDAGELETSSTGSQSASSVSSQDITRKESGKEKKQHSKTTEHTAIRPAKKELDLLDDMITVMLLPRYSQLVDYDNKKKHVILRILELVLDYMKTTPSLVEVPAPCVVLGDIHGQYRDLVRIFQMFNENKKHGIFNQRYLFLGDYVDRGHYSLEVVLLLFLLKMRHPTRFFLLRGNHEIRELNLSSKYYAFFTNIEDKLINTGFWEKFTEIYEYMPLAALVGGRVLCMHGGISQHLNCLKDIKNIEKPIEDPDEGTLASDLMWSDPNKTPQIELYSPNTDRHAGSYFNTRAVLETCKRLGVDLIVRAHQCPQRGFHFMEDIHELLTIFSAPNYNDTNPDRNDGALLILKADGKMEIRKYGSEDRTAIEMIPRSEKTRKK